jgi:uncharacterized protein (TIGR04141 family)
MNKKKIRLNVMLLKDGMKLEEPQDFIEGYSTANAMQIEEGETKAIFYKRLGQRKQPDWVKYFQDKIGGLDISQMFPKSQTSGASLFIQADTRVFAINFGTMGRFNIQRNAIDSNFGIYTANKFLNSDDNSTLKSVSSRVNETNPVNKQRQYGANISNNQFFITMEDNEALRELAVFNRDSDDIRRIIGKYGSLNVQFVFDEGEIPCLQHLPAKLKKILEIYNSVTKDDVKQLFKGLLPLNKEESKKLDLVLPTQLKNSPDSFFLFEPEIDFDLSLVSKFKIETDNGVSESDELALNDYLQLVANPQKQNLEDDSILVLDEDDKQIKKWSVFECLYGEIEHNGTNYILSHGEWFEIAKDRYERITKKIDEIIDPAFQVSDGVKDQTKKEIEKIKHMGQNQKINKENIFNSKLCEHLNGVLFDEGKRQITLYDDRFEICDILTPADKRFFHVKYNYGASALSHLFNQGFVSAKSYAKFKGEYAAKVNAHIPNDQPQLPNDLNSSCIH